MVQQRSFFNNQTVYDELRVDLLESIRDSISISSYQANATLDWLDKAIIAASSQQADWIVEYFLGLALNALAGKRHAFDIRGEIEFAKLEFDPSLVPKIP